MLIDHLLAALGDQGDHEAVKARDHALHLKAVHQKDRHKLTLFPQFVQEKIL